jgi:hypothetical protein
VKTEILRSEHRGMCETTINFVLTWGVSRGVVTTLGVLPRHGRHEVLCPDDSQHSLEVVRQHMQTHLRVDVRQRLHQDMRRSPSMP